MSKNWHVTSISALSDSACFCVAAKQTVAEREEAKKCVLSVSTDKGPFKYVR